MTDAETIAQIEARDEQRRAATIAKDAAALERLLDDDLRYVHGSGVTEDKRTFIERATRGYYDYRGLTPLAREFRIYDDVVLVNGDVRIEVVVNGTAKDFVSRYLQVWRRGDDGWRMLSWQSTPLAA